MKHVLFIVFTALCLTAFAQPTHRVKAEIDAVVVYMNQAQVSSKLSTSIPAGRSKIEITDLASTIDPNSIKVGGRGNFVLLSVNFEKDFISKKQQAYQDSLDSIGDSVELLQMKLSVNANEQKMVMDNTRIKSDNDDLFADDLADMSAYFKKKLTQLGEEKLSLNKELKELMERKQRIENQMQTDPSRNLPLGKIILSVQAEKAGMAQLDLSYQVYNAGWSPSYDIRVENTQSEMNLIYKAEVTQNTGVDWENVKLTLSTASVNRRTVKPELNPTYLYFFEERPPVPMRARAMAKEEDEAAPMAMQEMVVSSANYTELQENTLNKQFVISLPYNIKTGASETVEVQDLNIPANYVTYAVPRYDSNGFLLAEVTGWNKYGLLPASGNVYFEGAFVGKTYISNPGTDEKLKISLGRDERLEVERKELTDYKERRTFGSNIRENFGYEISLRNTRNEPIQVRVEDQIPVSQDSEISVDTEDLGNGVLNKDTGIITWEIQVPAQGTVKLPLKYEVKYPKDKKVANL